MAKKKRPTDTNQRAKLIVDIATGEVEEKKEDKVVKGSAGGKKGGIARAKKLSAKKRTEIAKNAAKKRWAK